MRRSMTILVVAALGLTGCATVSESRFNPFNWFGNSRAVPVATGDDAVNPLIPQRRMSIFLNSQPEAYPGTPVADITELLVERRPGGAIIRATGVANRVGPFDVRLTRDEAQSTPDTLVYTLRALKQPAPPATGPYLGQVTAAVWITDQDLRGIRTIRVEGAQSARSVTR